MKLKDIAKIIFTKSTASEHLKIKVYNDYGSKMWEGEAKDLMKQNFVKDKWNVSEIRRMEIFGIPKYNCPMIIYVY